MRPGLFPAGGGTGTTHPGRLRSYILYKRGSSSIRKPDNFFTIYKKVLSLVRAARK